VIDLAVLDAVIRLRAAGEPFLVATVVAVHGSSYRRPGARMIFTGDRREAGSVSGGCLERDLLRTGWWRLGDRDATVIRYDASDPEDRFALGCGGTIDILLERDRGSRPGDPFEVWATCLRDQQPRELATPYGVEPVVPPPRLFVCGDGHDAAPVAQLARSLGWDVLSGKPDDCAARADASHRALAIVMSHHFGRDRAYLRALLSSRVQYLGVLGPRHRTAAILDELGRADALADPRVHAPAGLALGADSPPEIALAIVAEMQAALAGVAVEHLRGRPGAIHERAEPAFDIDPPGDALSAAAAGVAGR
jgi:xanthine dehydrogenase accessory factor